MLKNINNKKLDKEIVQISLLKPDLLFIGQVLVYSSTHFLQDNNYRVIKQSVNKSLFK